MFRLMAVLAVAALSSCASQYERDFRREAAAMTAAPTSPEGPWEGEWRSEMNGHHGPLWCMIRLSDPNTGDFRYRAGWDVLEFGDYTHQVPVVREKDGSITFSGSMDLPGGAGRHDVEGRVTKDRFDARYRSDRGDRGSMKLTRPE